MKKTLVISFITSAIALSTLHANGQDISNHVFSTDGLGMYLDVDAGGLFQQDIQFVQKFGGGKISEKATFDPGVRVGISVGIPLTDSLTEEFETGLLYNSIDKLGGFQLSKINEGVDQYSIPLIAKLVYRFHNMGKFTPYVGAGIGGVLNVVDFKGAAGPTTDTDIQFAYQAEGGLSYALSDRATVSLAYKFMGSLDQSFKYFTETIDFQGIYTHAVLLSFRWKF